MVLCADKEAANTCMEARPVTPDTGAQPGEVSPADGPGPGELLRFRSAQGRRVVAAMILGAAVAGVRLPGGAVPPAAVRREPHGGVPGLGWLIAARAVEGIGGALMTPASLAIMTSDGACRSRFLVVSHRRGNDQ